MKNTLFLLVGLALLLSACQNRPAPAIAGEPLATEMPTPSPTDNPPAPSTTLIPTTMATTTPTVTPIPTPTATATPAPAAHRLTTGGCCWGVFWLDGKVAFIDRPTADAPAAFYGISPDGGTVSILEKRMGTFLNRGQYLSFQENGRLVIERRSDGKRLDLSRLPDLTGLSISLSPDGRQISWTVRESEGPYDQRRSQIWRAGFDGLAPQLVITLFGGGLTAWLPGDRWLMTGREDVREAGRSLFVYHLTTGKRIELYRALSFRNVSTSPDGEWVIFVVALDPQKDRNGAWLARADGSERHKLDWFGAFAWRDSRRILYMPFQTEAKAHAVWEYDVATGRSRPLTDPAVTPFKVAQGDFAFSPDGNYLAFVSADDFNIWVLPLPK